MQVEPLKVGVLIDYPGAPGAPNYIVDGLRLVLEEAVAARRIDRPVEVIERQVVGLPNGSYRAVRDAYDELVAEGCLVAFGPYISENVVPLRDHVERTGEMAIITMAGSEGALGEWCFALNNGSMAEEPVLLAAILKQDGRQRIAIAYEASLIGQEYLGFSERAYRGAGLEVVDTLAIPQVEADKVETVERLRKTEPDALVHVGFGHGLWGFNDALSAAGWDPPRYTTTASRCTRSTTTGCASSSVGSGSTASTSATRSVRPSSSGSRPGTGAGATTTAPASATTSGP